jgi:endonuclease/exonuclease/phosphatase family metal-dependent hydrolase
MAQVCGNPRPAPFFICRYQESIPEVSMVPKMKNSSLVPRYGPLYLWVILYIFLLSGCIPIHNIRPPEQNKTNTRLFTILTYNIRVGAGLEKFGRNPYLLKDEIQPNLPPILAAIRSVGPDIVGLQEVLGEDQAASIANALNMNYAYVSHGLDTYGTWWGVALLSKFPIRDVWRQEISSGRGNARANLYATISVFGRECVFVVMHKDRDQKRGYALRNTMKRIRKIKNPVVLLGDFNFRPDDQRHQILSTRFEDSVYLAGTKNAAYAEKRGTYPGKRGQYQGKRIDYILLDKGRFEVLNAGLLDEKYWPASDHIGYFAKVTLKRKKLKR